jgi:outer membrane protein
MKHLVLCICFLWSFPSWGMKEKRLPKVQQHHHKKKLRSYKKKIQVKPLDVVHDMGHPFIQALCQTYQSNPSLKAKLYEFLASAERAMGDAKSRFRPNISASLDSQHQKTFSPDLTPNSATKDHQISTTDSASLRLQQNLFSSGRDWAAYKIAKEKVKASRADLRSTEKDVLLSAIKVYLEVGLGQEVLRLREANEKFLKSSLQQVRAKAEVGEGTLTDVALAESRLSRAVADRVNAQADLENKKSTYFRLIGKMPGSVPQPKPLNKEALPLNMDAAVELAKKQDFQVIQYNYRRSIANHGLDVAYRSLGPSLNLDTAASRSFNTKTNKSVLNPNDPAPSTSTSLTLSLSIPIYQGGRDWSEIRASIQDKVQAATSYQAALDAAVENARSAWQNRQASLMNIAQYETQVRAADLNLKGKNEEMLVGEGTLTEVLDAQQELISAQVSLEQAKTQTILGDYQLLAATGQLTSHHLRLPVATPDLDRYLDESSGQWAGLPEDLHTRKD